MKTGCNPVNSIIARVMVVWSRTTSWSIRFYRLTFYSAERNQFRIKYWG